MIRRAINMLGGVAKVHAKTGYPVRRMMTLRNGRTPSRSELEMFARMVRAKIADLKRLAEELEAGNEP